MVGPTAISHIANLDLNVVSDSWSSFELFLILTIFIFVFLIGLPIFSAIRRIFIIFAQKSA